MNKILLISPEYMGYAEEIRRGLGELGHDVVFVSDRPNANTFKKIITRVTPKLNDIFYLKRFSHYFEKHRGEIETVIIVNGEGLSEKIVAKLLEVYPNSYRTFYTWDSFRNKAQDYAIFDQFHKRFTFDIEDAKEPNWEYKPLFYVDTCLKAESTHKFDMCFVGSFQQHRFDLLKNLVDNDKIKGTYKLVSQNAYLHYFYMLRNVFYLRNFCKIVQKKKLRLSEVAQVNASSASVLDLPSPRQTGLTIRVFETLASGKKLVTTSRGISQEAFFNPDFIYIIDAKLISDQNEELAQFVNDTDCPLAVNLEQYSLNEWLKDFLVAKE